MSTILSRSPMLLFAMFIVSTAVLFFNARNTPTSQLTLWNASSSIVAAHTEAPAAVQGDAQPDTSNRTFRAVASSVPLGVVGDVGFNIRAALDASGGALRHVTVQPGATWSFNAAVGSPANVEVRSVGGIPGGGWCDLASRYVQAARSLLPDSAIRFRNHVASTGIGLTDVADEDTVAIWNIDGQPGTDGTRGDLEITNTLDKPLFFQVIEYGDGELIVRAAVANS
ncbi:MAG TPA: hypothetical protein VFX76_21175 [Roseiflexaceae bacterium]|nr:hypothetical protein [Roseiflexaceae bacterium]